MDPTEEAFVAQVREASIAQVTHVQAKAQSARRGEARKDRNFYGIEDV